MRANVGMTDKAIRLLLAIVLIILFYKGTLTGVIGATGLIVALLLTITTLLSFCPLYKLFKINTTNLKKTLKDSKKTK